MRSLLRSCTRYRERAKTRQTHKIKHRKESRDNSFDFFPCRADFLQIISECRCVFTVALSTVSDGTVLNRAVCFLLLDINRTLVYYLNNNGLKLSLMT